MNQFKPVKHFFKPFHLLASLKYCLLLFGLAFSLLSYGQSGASRLEKAEDALGAGKFVEVLTLLADAPADDLKYYYLKGLALEGLDSIPAAEEHWLTYLDLAENADEVVYHRSLGHFCLANNYLLRGEWDAAERSLRISQGSVGMLPDTLSAKIWNSYGVLRLQLNEEEEALAAFREAVDSWESAGLAKRALLPRFYLARLLLWRDSGAAAREVALLMEIPVTPLDDLHPAMAALTLSEIYLRQGKVVAARTAFEEVEARVVRFQGERRFKEQAYRQSVLGLLHLQEGREDLALAAFSAVDNVDRSMILPPGEALYFKGLSFQYSGRFKDAIESYGGALAAISMENQRLRATLYEHIGECHLAQNSFSLALDHLTSAGELWKKTDGNGGTQTKLLTAEALLGNRDTTAARQLLAGIGEYCRDRRVAGSGLEICLRLGEVLLRTEAIDEAKAVFGGLEPEEVKLTGLTHARWLAGLANIYWVKDETDQAGELAKQSIEALLGHWSGLKGMKGLRLQRNYFDRIFRLGISCALDKGDAGLALWIAEVARGLDLKGDLLAALPEKRLDQRRDYIKDIADQLSAQQVMVCYLQGMTNLHAVIVEGGGAVKILSLGDAKELEDLVNKYLSYLADSVTNLDLDKPVAAKIYGKVCVLSHTLFRQLVEPLALPTSAEVLIVPDGNLHFLSFASLLQEMPAEPILFQTHDYLVREHAVAYLPSIELLLGQDKDEAIRAYPFAAFAPSYGSGSGLTALLNNQSEVAQLEEAFAGDYHYGSGANREELPAPQTAETRLLHLGMHAVFNPEFPDSSLLAFSGAEVRGNAAWYYGGEMEEGFGAYPFVFLSACQTANGKYYRGEGALSITRSMMAGGSKHIVSSLWNVDDSRVGELIEKFYHSLEESPNSVQALRTAQLDYLQQANRITAYPYYWAGFFHYGLSAKVMPKAKFNYWYLGAGITLLLLVAAGWQRYR